MKRRLQPANDRALRPRPRARAILILVGCTRLRGSPRKRRAAVRTGSVQDPQGDASALSGPVLDIESAAVRYDDGAGTLRVTWTYYGDIRPNTESTELLGGGGLAVGSPLVFGVTGDHAYVGWYAARSADGTWPVATNLQIWASAARSLVPDDERRRSRHHG